MADGLIPVAPNAGLVLRAEVQSAAGEASAALATLRVAATRLGSRRGDPDLARAALEVLRELPAELLGQPARERLRSRLAGALRRRP